MDFFDRRLRVNLAAFQDDYDPRVIAPARQSSAICPPNPDPGPVFRGLTDSTCPAGTEAGNRAPTSGGSPWITYCERARQGSRCGAGDHLARRSTTLHDQRDARVVRLHVGAPKTLKNSAADRPTTSIRRSELAALQRQFVRVPRYAVQPAGIFGGSLTPARRLVPPGVPQQRHRVSAAAPGSDNNVPWVWRGQRAPDLYAG